LYLGISVFELFQEQFDAMVGACPFFAYLWLYHSTEEIEHVHIALSSFEETYQTQLFSQQNLDLLNSAVDNFARINHTVTTDICAKVGFSSNPEEVRRFSEPLMKKLQSVRAKYRVGFMLNTITDLRHQYIELFDTNWELQLRRTIEERLSSTKKAV
jgi:hypothetical protein